MWVGLAVCALAVGLWLAELLSLCMRMGWVKGRVKDTFRGRKVLGMTRDCESYEGNSQRALVQYNRILLIHSRGLYNTRHLQGSLDFAVTFAVLLSCPEKHIMYAMVSSNDLGNLKFFCKELIFH